MNIPSSGLTVLLGGARSGKSDLAVALGKTWASKVIFVATATAGDADMASRIDRHRDDRPDGWATFESARFNTLEAAAIDSDPLLIVDCLTMLIANLLLGGDDSPGLDEPAVLAHVDELTASLASRRGPTLLISNETGMGVHPPTELGRHYRDVLGRANRAAVENSHAAALIVAGRLVPLGHGEPTWN